MPTPEDVFRRADLVSVHARLTPDSRHIVNAARLGLMRPGALLVNSARGGLVDYDAVAAALAADSSEGQPSTCSPRSRPTSRIRSSASPPRGANLVLTPHIAGASVPTAHACRRRRRGGAADFLAGEPALNPLVDGTRTVVS